MGLRAFKLWGWVGLAFVLSMGMGCRDREPDTCDNFWPDFLEDDWKIEGPPLPRVTLGVGDPCWMNKCSPSIADHRIDNHYLISMKNDRRACRADLFCHETLGCRPRIPRGESCDHVNEDILRGVCAEFEDVCYPSEPTGDDPTQPGPRICRPLPSAVGEWCDPSTLAVCRSPEVDGAWKVAQDFGYALWRDYDIVPEIDRIQKVPLNKGYPDRADLQLFTRPADYPAEAEYEALVAPGIFRPLQLYCEDYACAEAPQPGEPCAELSPARLFPTYGHMNFACAQPLTMAVPDSTDTQDLSSAVSENQYSLDLEKAVFCVEGTCQAFEDMDPESCFQLTGADSEEDPAFCGQMTQLCKGGCFSVCRKDGTCGLCNTCELADGTVFQVDSIAECPDALGGELWWSTASEYDWIPNSTWGGMGCGSRMKLTFNDLEPSPGALFLELGAGGNMAPGERYLTLQINGETENIVVIDGEETGFIWDTPSECKERIGTSGDPICECLPVQSWDGVELLLADRWRNSEKLEIVLEANEDWCLDCETRMNGRIHHRTNRYKEQIRDDRVCP